MKRPDHRSGLFVVLVQSGYGLFLVPRPDFQTLVTNQHLDKLAAARVDFQACGMLDWRFGPPDLPPDPPANNLQDEEDDNGGAVNGDIDSEVILTQIPSESPEQIFISP